MRTSMLNVTARVQANACSAAALNRCCRPMGVSSLRQRRSTSSRKLQQVRSGEGQGFPTKTVQEILAEANALLADVGGQPAMPSMMSSIEELEDLGYVCDESGCVMVLPGGAEEAGSSSRSLEDTLLQGSNWKIGMVMAASDSDFPAVVSGPGWSIPLTVTELKLFIDVLQRLRSVVASLQAEGQWLPGSGDRPISRAKWDAGRIYMQAVYAMANGQPSFAMEFIFRTSLGRPLQASWPAEVVATIEQALDAKLGVPTPTKSTATANVA